MDPLGQGTTKYREVGYVFLEVMLRQTAKSRWLNNLLYAPPRGPALDEWWMKRVVTWPLSDIVLS